MSQKLYHSHSFLFPILRYSRGNVYPEYELSFTFWGDKPVDEIFNVGEKVSSLLWCPKEILPHRNYVHQPMHELKCGRTPLEGFPFKYCHEPLDTHATLSNGGWSYGIDNYDAVITALNIQDVVIGTLFGSPYRQYKFTADAYAQWRPCSITIAEDLSQNPEAPPQVLNYNVDATVLDNGDILFSASIHAINPDKDQLHGEEEPLYSQDTPLADFSLGSYLSIPFLPIPLACYSYKVWKDEGQFHKHMWNVIYQCSGIYTASQTDNLPDEVINDFSYGLNRNVIRSVSGGLTGVNMAASFNGRKIITAYSLTQEPVYTLGSPYSGGIVMSDVPSKMTKTYWTSNGRFDDHNLEKVVVTFYRHDIEVVL